MDIWPTSNFLEWLTDPWTSLRLTATVLATYTAYSWYSDHYRTRHIRPSPHRQCQSVIVDEKNGVRGSILAGNFPQDDQVHTYYDLFCCGLKISRDRPCLGRRSSFDDPVEWWTYEEVDRRVRDLGSALLEFGVAKTQPDEHYIVGIYAKNSPEWVVAMLTCSAYSLVALPLYDTLGKEALEHICHQAVPTALICDNLERAKNVMKWSGDALKCVAITGDLAALNTFRQTYSGSTKVLSFDELLTLGRQNLKPVASPDPQDLFLLGYTSGSTGVPKGVLSTHENCTLATFSGVHILNQSQLIIDKPEKFTHLSYLPLAHCYERINLTTFLYKGGRIGFLTSDATGLLTDLHDYKPCYFTTVPRVLMRVYNQVLQNVSSKYLSKVLLALLRWAIKQKLDEQNRGIYRKSGLLDRLFFKPIRDKVGGNVQIVVSASAPVSDEVLSFARAAFSCPVLECYGLTETSGVLSATLIGDMVPGHTGTPYLDFLIKLSDVPEMDIYVARDGIGEICAKGKACTAGYYKDEVNTRKLFDSDGFLLTGDIGTWTPEGSLKVVDRRKSFFKLAQGEYVTPKKIEEVYITSLLVNNVFVDGDSHFAYVVAVIEPNMEELRKRLLNPTNGCVASGTVPCANDVTDFATIDVENATDEELCRHPVVRRLFLSDLTQLGKRAGLNGLEQVKAIHLTAQPFSVENGLLTPTLKISRPNVRRHFAGELRQLYSEIRNR